MEQQGINCIDLRDVLNEHSYHESVFNKKYDAGAWSSIGAFYGMRTLTERIHKDIPEVKILERDEYDISKTVIDKLYNSNQTFYLEVPQYTLKVGYSDITGAFTEELDINKTYSSFLIAENHSDKAAGIERLLVFEDDLYAPFAVARSKETAMVLCLQNVINFEYYYNIFNPEVVVFENMEHVVNNTYFSQDAMESINHYPAVLKNYPKSDFQERRDLLLAGTKEEYYDASAVLIPGRAVDKLFISKGLNTQYAYLITDDRVIDLKKEDSGAYVASVRHGDLSTESNVVLYTVSNNQETHYAVIPVIQNIKNILHIKTSSENASFDEKALKSVMINTKEDDGFSYTALQLYDSDITEYQSNICSLASNGVVEGCYCHNMPSGDYTLLLRACSENNNEWNAFKVHLVEGQSYWFTYNVKELSDKRVIISDFSFSEPEQ
jgi:hypothetical protein